MIRRAKPLETPLIVTLAVRALDQVDVGDMLISVERIHATAQRLVSDPSSLVLVHERDGVLDGFIAVGVQDSTCFERKMAGITGWYAETPGSGYKMLREALAWAAGRRAIKAIGLAQDFAGDPRVDKLLERAGLSRRGSVFARY